MASDSLVRLHYIVTEEEEGLLREFLLNHKQLSRKSLRSIKLAGELLVNGESVTVRKSVKQGDQVTVIFPQEESSPYLVPQPVALAIIYEDEDLLVLNKPAGQCVHPTFTQKEGTLANGLMYYWQQKGLQRTFHAVNRLDKDTSGLILIAQHRFSHQQLSIQQKAGDIKRTYYAVVEGNLAEEQGVIEAPIGRAADSIIEREVRPDGQNAKTKFRVLKRFPTYTWVEVELMTGRTHQIRVHFRHIGHPLLGDQLYQGPVDSISRQALHAYQLQFQHPRTKEMLHFEAPLPPDIEELLSQFEDGS